MFAVALSPFAKDVADGLARPQKTLPASWLYDELGSALFEAITLLPEYGLTRADSKLLERVAPQIIDAAHAPRLIVELGSGSGTKTRHILSAASAHGRLEYAPIDISGSALAACTASLKSLHGVNVKPIEAEYLEGIDQALVGQALPPALRGPSRSLAGRSPTPIGRRALILFLGSTIGNFTKSEAETFLREIRDRARPGDTLLVGADLIKDRARLISAYDDSLGVTAAFNLNLLIRINRELGGTFDPALFAHEARFNESCSRIEMHLRSRVAQTVRIEALDCEFEFREGETIWTESSHKFEPNEIARIGEHAGWRTLRQWIDPDWGFSETLFAASS